MPDVYMEKCTPHPPTAPSIFHLTIVLEYIIHSGNRHAIKCEFRYTPKGKFSDFSTAYLKHGFSVGQTHASDVKEIIYGALILQHKISGCVTFAVE